MTPAEFSILLDAPNEPASRVQIAKLGEDFHHPKYGKFAITSDDVATWQKHLSQLPGGRALIDADHQADRTPRNTEASGWITGVSLDGDTAMADVEWTDKGQDAITNKRYLFISPTYGKFRDETGKVHENTLFGAALTNRPFLNMPAVTLASPERVSVALDQDPAARFYTRALDGELGELTEALVLLDVSQADRDKAKAANNSLPDGSYPIENVKQLKAAAILAASKHGNWQAAKTLIRRRAKELGVDATTLVGFGSGSSDSRRLMNSEALAKALGLEDDKELVTTLDALELDETAEKKLLDAATGLREKAEKPAETDEQKTLEQQAADQGLVMLDAGAVKQLQTDAAAGALAQKELHAAKFDTAFELALNHKDGPKVTPAERDQLHHFFTLDADATLKMISDREPIAPAKPHGGTGFELDDQADPETVARAGLHPGSHEVYAKVQAKLKQLDKPQSDFTKVLDQMTVDGEL